MSTLLLSAPEWPILGLTYQTKGDPSFDLKDYFTKRKGQLDPLKEHLLVMVEFLHINVNFTDYWVWNKNSYQGNGRKVTESWKIVDEILKGHGV